MNPYLRQYRPQYGSVTLRHFRKVLPWLTRLEQATNGLREDMRRGNRMEVLRSLEDVWFWVGRSMCEVLSAQDMMAQNPALAKRAAIAMNDATAVASQAKSYKRKGSLSRNLDYPGAHDGQMMKNRLVTIGRMARILNRAIKDDDKLPTWTTDQVAISEDRLVKVTDYLISKIERRK